MSPPFSSMLTDSPICSLSLSISLVHLCPSLVSCHPSFVSLCLPVSVSLAFFVSLGISCPLLPFLSLSLSFSLPWVSLSDPSLHPHLRASPLFLHTSPPPRLREIPQPEQHRGPERGVPAPRAPCHPPWLSPGRPPRSPDPALHPLALPSPLWGDSGVTRKKVKGAGGGGWGKGFFKKNQKVINNMQPR